MKGFFDREGPHPIRPLKIHYIQTTTHATYIQLLGCHLGCLRKPRNLCVLDAAWISKFRNPSGIEDTKLRPEAKRKFWPCTSLGGVRKNGQHHPLSQGAMLRLRGCAPPEANRKLGSTTPFCRGNAVVARVRAPGGQQKIGQHHPLLQGERCCPIVQT